MWVEQKHLNHNNTMKKESIKIDRYDRPESEVIYIKVGSIICKSLCDGENEGTEDEELEP